MNSVEKPRGMKENNIRFSLDFIRRADVFAVAEVSSQVELSKTTVKKMIDLLTAAGLVVSMGKGDSTDEGGKKPELYKFNPNYGYCLATQVTPDAVVVATTDLNAEITSYDRQPIRANRNLDAVLAKLVEMVASTIRQKEKSNQRLIGLVVALPGLADSSTGTSLYSPHFPEWGRDVPFAELLGQGLAEELGRPPEFPIRLDCVNRYQAVAEREKGVATGVGSFVIIDALEEGIGSGVVLDGLLKRGAQSLSGEIGHLTLQPNDGPVCICGNKGCFEALVSAKRLKSLAGALLPGVAVIGGTPVEALTLEEICLAAHRGDSSARVLIQEAARWFVLGIANLVLLVDPELIVLQGQYVKAGDYFLDLLREGVKHLGLPHVEKRVRLEYSRMGETRGIVGGAAVLIAEFFVNRLEV